MMKMKTFLCFLVLASVVDAVIYQCTYSTKTWANVGILYGCTVGSITAGTTADIEDVQGTLTAGKTFEDIEALSITRKVVTKIPENVENFLPNLKCLQIYSSKLETITTDDLRLLPNLEYINLGSNLLKALDGNLFNFNLKLKVLFFSGNDIESVGQGILDGLTDLVNVDFQTNNCINLAGQTPERIEVLKEELLLKCLPFGETIAPKTTTIAAATFSTTSALTTTSASLTTSALLTTTKQITTTLPQITTESCPTPRCTLNEETDELNLKFEDLLTVTEELKDQIEKLKVTNTELQKESEIHSEKIAELEKKVSWFL
jgi:hypothetical protein